MIAASAAGFRVSHSQITTTRQPADASADPVSKSRATFAANFDCQKSDRVFGSVAPRQPRCRCQKQP